MHPLHPPGQRPLLQLLIHETEEDQTLQSGPDQATRQESTTAKSGCQAKAGQGGGLRSPPGLPGADTEVSLSPYIIFVVDEHAERMMLPEAHARAIKAMLARHRISVSGSTFSSAQRLDDSQPSTLNSQPRLSRFVAGTDVFSRQSDGTSVAKQYAKHGIHLRPANTERVSGWAEILHRLGDMDRNIMPRLFFHARCGRLLSTLPDLQHDPHRPEDVLKVDCDEQGAGGDDAADALRYLIASQPKRAGFAAV